MDEDASVYEQAVMSGRTIYYRPEGVQRPPDTYYS